MHFMTPAFFNVSTLLTLDSGPPQWVDLTNPGFGSAVRWSAMGLTNDKHTLVSSPGRGLNGEVASWGEADAFMYVKNLPPSIDIPTSESITSYTVVDSEGSAILTNDDPRITYGPPGAWVTDSTNVPNCARTKSGVRITSMRNATFSFDFTGALPTLWTQCLNKNKTLR